jgi:hypothetical protein
VWQVGKIQQLISNYSIDHLVSLAFPITVVIPNTAPVNSFRLIDADLIEQLLSAFFPWEEIGIVIQPVSSATQNIINWTFSSLMFQVINTTHIFIVTFYTVTHRSSEIIQIQIIEAYFLVRG